MPPRPLMILRGLSVAAILGAFIAFVGTEPLHAQQRVTLEEAVAAARSAVPQLRIARADSAAAAARLITASTIPNPSLNLGYSKSPPPYHLELEQPFEFPWLRKSRIEAARLSAQAAAMGVDIAGARLRYDVEAAYANAVIARAITALSTQNASDADELVRIAAARRDAGDAAELDVDLARVFAAAQHRTASVDSLAAIVATLELQGAMGMSASGVTVVPVDTFVPLPSATTPAAGSLAMQQAELESQAAAGALKTAESSSRFSEVVIRAGIETGDKDQRGILPTIGFSLPLPIFDRNRGPIAEAKADRDRAIAALEQARLEQALGLAVAERQRAAQQVILAQDRDGLENARRVAARAQTAYREGEYTLASVIEAQRNARDALRQYYEDMGALWLAQAAFTLARTSGGKP